MKGFPQGLRDLNQSGVEFVLVDLETALTFMDIAEVSGIDETVRRNHKNAHEAYKTALKLLPDLRLDDAQKTIVQDKLNLLQQRLKQAGIDV
jgi:hypothetical protein